MESRCRVLFSILSNRRSRGFRGDAGQRPKEEFFYSGHGPKKREDGRERRLDHVFSANRKERNRLNEQRRRENRRGREHTEDMAGRWPLSGLGHL